MAGTLEVWPLGSAVSEGFEQGSSRVGKEVGFGEWVEISSDCLEKVGSG